MLYLDLDGVLADFDQALKNADVEINEAIHDPEHLWSPDDKARDQIIKAKMRETGFWTGIPKMKDADILWTFCQQFRPTVLTAKPYKEGESKTVAEEKFDWVNNNLGPLPRERFICCLRSEKQNFIGHVPHPKQILVDDHPDNCSDWEKAGGIAVLHKDASTTIEELKRIIYDVT